MAQATASTAKEGRLPTWLGRRRSILLAHKGQAVGALIHGGIALVGADLDLAERAVVLKVAVVGALGNGTLDGLIGLRFHDDSPFIGLQA